MTAGEDSGAILIWGAGAIGGTIGAYLARAGHPVVLVDVVAEHVAATVPISMPCPKRCSEAALHGFGRLP